MRVNVVTLIIFMGVFSFGVGVGTLFFMPTFYLKERRVIMQSGIGYVDDNTTCKGNDHNPDDEDEITE